MKKRVALFVVMAVGLLLSTQGIVYTAMSDDISSAKGDIGKDYQIFSQWIGEELSKPLSFLPGIGPDLPANVLALPGFEVGVSIGASIRKLDINSFNTLPTDTIQPTELDLPDKLMIPFPLIHAKVGLPSIPFLGKTDAGIKLGALSYEINDFNIKNKVYGLQIRKEILEDGLTSPGAVSVNLSFNKLDGSVEVKRSYQQVSTEAYSGIDYNQEVDSLSTWKTEWDINSVGLMAMYSKKLAVVNLFFGVGVDQNAGDIDTIIKTEGTITLSTVGAPLATDSETMLISGFSSVDPEKSNVRIVGGIEFGLTLLKIGISTEYKDSDNYALAGNIRFQF